MARKFESSVGRLNPWLQLAAMSAFCIPGFGFTAFIILALLGIPMQIVGSPPGVGYVEWRVNCDRPLRPDVRSGLPPVDAL
jgi:hypothetical protein